MVLLAVMVWCASDYRAATASALPSSHLADTSCRRSALIVRGGDAASDGKEEEDEEENARLDAYIEDLLSTVEDGSTTDDASATDHQESMDKEEEEEEEEEDTKGASPKLPSDSSENESRKKLSDTRKASRQPKQQNLETIEEGEEDEDEDEDAEAISAVDEKLDQEDVESNSENEETKTIESDQKDETSDQVSDDDSPDTLHNSNGPPEFQQDTSVAMAVPNPLFRFLLNRGRVGHVLVMVMALFFDWLALYLPPVSNSMDWIYVRVVPKRMREPPRRRGMGGGRGAASVAAGAATVTTTLARTGTSRKKRREMIQEADQVALQQLKSLDSNSLYRHVSLDFMKRHALGPYRGTEEEEEEDAEYDGLDGGSQSSFVSNGEDGNLVSATSKKSGAKGKNYKKSSSNAIPDEPEDWVIQALTHDPKKSAGGRSSSTKIRPTISVELGSNGVGLSFGLEMGGRGTREKYRESVAKAVAQQPLGPPVSQRKSKQMTQRTSDASSGLMGKIRASSFSRSLLGAYPGDAAPVEDAADTHGLAGLAERYGYTSDSEEEEDDLFGSLGHSSSSMSKRVKKRRKVKRKPNQSSSSLHKQGTGDFFGLDGGEESSPSWMDGLADESADNSTGLAKQQKRRADKRSSSLSTQSRSSSRRSSGSSLLSDLSKRAPASRPATQRLNEIRSRKRDDEKPFSTRTSMRNGSKPAIEKTIPRPSLSPNRSAAMDRIKELREKSKSKSDD